MATHHQDQFDTIAESANRDNGDEGDPTRYPARWLFGVGFLGGVVLALLLGLPTLLVVLLTRPDPDPPTQQLPPRKPGERPPVPRPPTSPANPVP
jgi:hypothetical protein